MNYENIELLVKEIQQSGDVELKGELYTLFLPYICLWCNKITIYGFTADDLKQECYLWLNSAIDKYKGSNTFVAYVTATIRNNLFALYKKHKNVPIPSEYLEQIDQHDLCDDIITHLDIESLSKNLSKLSVYEQRILEDYYFNDLSLVVIANDLHKKYITVVKTKDRALDKIKKNY